MTIMNFDMVSEDNNAKLYKATINGCVPVDDTGKRFFNRGVDRSLIEFPDWQRTDTSSEKKIRNMVGSFDKNLMDPLILVAHPEIQKFRCVNGYHRYTATGMLPEPMNELPCIIIFFDGTDEERELFEIDLFLKQSVSIETLKEIQMHEAKIRKGDEAAVAIDKVCKKYNITVVPKRGYRPKRVLGSYSSTYSIAHQSGGCELLDDIMMVIDIAGYMEEPNGLSSKIMLPVGNVIKAFPFCARELGEFMRKMTPNILLSKAVAKYPERGWRVQLTLYLQDWVVNTYHVEPRFNDDGKPIKVA